MIPDGLVQARITNFVANFPNLGGGPLQVQNYSDVSSGGGISRKRKPDQPKGPTSNKRSKNESSD